MYSAKTITTMAYIFMVLYSLQSTSVYTTVIPAAVDYMCAYLLSHVRLFVTAWTVARQGPLSMGFSKQENWSGLPYPPSGDLPKQIKPLSLTSPALADGCFTVSTVWKAQSRDNLKESFSSPSSLANVHK